MQPLQPHLQEQSVINWTHLNTTYSTKKIDHQREPGQFPCHNQTCSSATSDGVAFVGASRYQLSDHRKICSHSERHGCDEHDVKFTTYHFFKNHYKNEHNKMCPLERS